MIKGNTFEERRLKLDAMIAETDRALEELESQRKQTMENMKARHECLNDIIRGISITPDVLDNTEALKEIEDMLDELKKE